MCPHRDIISAPQHSNYGTDQERQPHLPFKANQISKGAQSVPISQATMGCGNTSQRRRLYVVAEPGPNWPSGVTTTGGRPPRPHLTSNLFTHLISPLWRPRPVQRHPSSDPVSPSCSPRASLSNLSSTSSSSSVTLFIPKRSAHSGSQ